MTESFAGAEEAAPYAGKSENLTTGSLTDPVALKNFESGKSCIGDWKS
jgi:hypothetical protein